ncbi:DHS-like NAD/FAD-binding domain-containing protein [Radiomyces spectabilis]|uniref:DHS-like NAD/FAD-binding domain-containing protein n=1 Tax=Radiomyces spectabilis TaxID=64574 RepID=UPI002220FD53|nr:DHS-like NAD/FAD-binding domain-containing protein [Radiomyces spectabilis]KAI8393330.1 DHS-like NAD/FAD-binding domain-containing protein [Radiomyces spectabilis]
MTSALCPWLFEPPWIPFQKKSKRILFVTGAGISCSGGIPDFRSSDGLYNLVKKKHPSVVLRGKELFDAMLFKDENRTRCFYTFMAELKSLISTALPTRTHSFIRDIQERGQLMRCYTQNIDCLEESLDLPTVQLHGSMNKVKCTLCAASYDFSTDHENLFREGNAPPCPKCEEMDNERTRLGKRSLATGTLRPDIVLYNEDHPHGETIGQLQASDLKKRPDLMIVMGTSLKIPALKKFIKQAARIIHSTKTGRVIFVNRTPPTKEWEKVFDYEVQGDTDEWVRLTEIKLADEKALAAARTRLRRSLSVMKEEEDDEKENINRTRVVKRAKVKAESNTTTTQMTLTAFRVSKISKPRPAEKR